MRLLLFSLFISISASADRDVPPVRLGVDIYNSVGSNQRLIAFMKVGAHDQDQRYLGFLNARIADHALPRAFLAGQMIYFRGLSEPLKVVDLKQRVFSFRGQRIDLRRSISLERRMAELEKIVYPRGTASLIWDWFFPFAYAATEDPARLTSLAALLAVSGVTTGAQCLSERPDATCTRQFLGTLAAVGAVGGLRGKTPPASVFCSPDFQSGGQRFVIAGEGRPILSVSRRYGEFEITPTNLRAGSVVSNNAAGELLGSCRSGQALANINVALAYPPTRAAVPQTVVASTRRATTGARAPAAASSVVRYYEARPEQGGAAR